MGFSSMSQTSLLGRIKLESIFHPSDFFETSEVAFFPRLALPSLSLGRTTAAQIDRMFHHAEHPELATDFD